MCQAKVDKTRYNVTCNQLVAESMRMAFIDTFILHQQLAISTFHKNNNNYQPAEENQCLKVMFRKQCLRRPVEEHMRVSESGRRYSSGTATENAQSPAIVLVCGR